MIQGFFNNNRPAIFIVVASSKGGVQEIPVLVDTGFTGELKIGPNKALELGLKISHTEPITMGDGRTSGMGASLARVSMEGIANTANVLIGEGKDVIGVGLLKGFGYTLNADFKYNNFYLKKSK